MGSSSSICSLLAATTLGVIVPNRDEKKMEGREAGREGWRMTWRGGERGRGSKAWKTRVEKLETKRERCVNLTKRVKKETTGLGGGEGRPAS